MEAHVHKIGLIENVLLDIPQQQEDLEICSKVEIGNSKSIYCLFVEMYSICYITIYILFFR